MLTENEIKKDLMRSKSMAKFSHYSGGKLFYNVDLQKEEISGTYQFPINVVQITTKEFRLTPGEVESDTNTNLSLDKMELSEDLGDTNFYSEIRGSELNRWIAKAFNNNQFIKLTI